MTKIPAFVVKILVVVVAAAAAPAKNILFGISPLFPSHFTSTHSAHLLLLGLHPVPLEERVDLPASLLRPGVDVVHARGEVVEDGAQAAVNLLVPMVRNRTRVKYFPTFFCFELMRRNIS